MWTRTSTLFATQVVMGLEAAGDSAVGTFGGIGSGPQVTQFTISGAGSIQGFLLMQEYDAGLVASGAPIATAAAAIRQSACPSVTPLRA